MTKAKPCQHRRSHVKDYEAQVFEEAQAGRPAWWGVRELLVCSKCGDSLVIRWAAGKLHKTARAALKAYGVPEADLPAPPNHKEKKPVTVPGIGWPFPISAHDWGAEGSPLAQPAPGGA